MINTKWFNAIEKYNIKNIEKYIKKYIEKSIKHIDINIVNEYNDTALIILLASINKRPSTFETIKLLLNQPNIDVNVQNYLGYTALMIACYNKYTNIVKLLLKYPDIDVNIKNQKDNDDNGTALIIASHRGHKEIVELLLQHPTINVNLTNQWNYTALHKVCYKNTTHCFSYNQDNYENYNEIIKLLLNHPDIDVNAIDYCEVSALMYVCRYHYYNHNGEILKLFLNKPNIDINIKNKSNQTALFVACNYDILINVKLLLERPEIKITNELEYCIKTNKIELVQIFYEKFAFDKLNTLQICNKEFNYIFEAGGAFEYFRLWLIHRLIFRSYKAHKSKFKNFS